MIYGKHYTTILEFTVLVPVNELEYIGEVISLSQFGEYCPNNSLRGYSLWHFIKNPVNYAITKIVQQGIVYSVPLIYEGNDIKEIKQ